MIQWSLLLSHRHLPLWLFALKNEKSISNLHSAFKKKQVLWFFMENLCTQNSFLCHSAIQLPPWHVLSLDKNQPSPQLSIHQPYPKKNKSVPQFFSWLVFLTLKKKKHVKKQSHRWVGSPTMENATQKNLSDSSRSESSVWNPPRSPLEDRWWGALFWWGSAVRFERNMGKPEMKYSVNDNGKMWWFDKLNEEIFWGMTLLIL